MAIFSPTFRLVRAEDHVVLDVTLTNLTLGSAPSPAGQPLLTTGSTAGQIAARFGSQQVLEYATPAAVAGQPAPARAVQNRPIYAPASEVVVRVPANTSVAFSVAGILDALSRFELVTPATRFAFPRRLFVVPPGGSGPRMVHAADPAASGGATELWTSRYALAGTSEQPVPVKLSTFAKHPGPPPEISETLLAHSLTDNNVDTFAALSQTKPVTMTDLALSGLGGWITLDGTWPKANPTLPPDRLRHETRQGRDQYQHNVQVGRLAPFGNLCVLTSTTIRELETGTRRAAALRSIANLDILEPTASFPETLTEVVGSQTFTRGNPWPWASITIANPPAGQQGNGPSGTTIYLVGGAEWRFEVTAVDWADQVTRLHLPLLFVPGTDPLSAGHRNAWLTRNAQNGLDLRGQPLALTSVPPPAPLPPGRSEGQDGRSAAARNTDPPSPTATTVLADTLKMTFLPNGQPQVSELTGRLPSADAPVRDVVGQAGAAVSSGVGQVTLAYAKPYLENAYTALNRQGQVFLQVVERQGKQAALELGKAAAGGLAGLDLPIAAVSASYGTVAGIVGKIDSTAAQASLAKLAGGKVDLQFLTKSVGTLLGLVPLDEIVDLGADLNLDDAQKVVSDASDGKVTKTVTFDVPLFKRTPQGQVVPFRKGFIELRPRSDIADPKLKIVQTLTADAGSGEVHSATTCEIKGLELCVFYQSDPDPDEPALVTVPLKTVSVAFRDTEKPEIDVQFSAVRFGGLLSFVGVLAELIDDLGLSDPPALEITPTGARSSFSFQVPAVAVGMFALENLTFATSLELNFVKQPAVLLLVEFSSFDHPFRLTVSLLGGGGYLRIGAASDGLALIEGSLSFGAALSVNLGVAAASVEAMGGVCFRYDRNVPLAEIVAFLRIRGELNVLGLISVSVALTVTLTYDVDRNSLIGEAVYVVQVSVAFFSQSVSVPFKWEIVGGNADPTFAELMAPDDWVGELPWDTYCLAYA